MDKALLSGERQVAESLKDIRRDHAARYMWAASVLGKPTTVVDIGCGCGYGTKQLAEAGHRVVGIDDSEEAIAFARQHYAGPEISYMARDATFLRGIRADAAVCFELIEHVRDPGAVLKALRCKRLLASVPNEAVYPFNGQKFHFRHYRKVELEQLLKDCGWAVLAWFTQDDTKSDVRAGDNGWTLIADAVRA